MFRNYLKTLLRNMQKHKLHTAINIIGMAVAFTCTITLVLLVYFQVSFDRFHENKARLYEVYNFSNGPQGIEQSNAMAYPLAPALKAENIGVERATRYKHGGRAVRYGDKELELQTQLVDEDFFRMFSFPISSGSKTAPLSATGNVVITEFAAKKIFGNAEPVGKQLSANVAGEWKALVVSAVAKDFPPNSSIKFDLLARSEIAPDYTDNKDRWDAQNHTVFVQLSAAANQKQVEQQLRLLIKKYKAVDTGYMKKSGYLPDAAGDFYSLRLLPLPEMHFNAAINGGNAISKAFLYILLLVAAVIVMIACFNFINLNIGLAFTRTKEIGIRKCLGAGKRQVWLQVWGESFFTVFVAMLIGTAITAFVIGYLSKTTRIGLDSSMLLQPSVVGILILILFSVSFAASGYPSFIMAKLKTVEILKGKISLKRPGVFRNALIVVQFVIACVLISATFVIYKQLQHLRNAPLGYTTSSLISVPIHDQGSGKKLVSQMRNRLQSQTSIVSVTGTSVNLGIGTDGSMSKSASGFDFNGRPISTVQMDADVDILKTLNLKPKEGRDFSAGSAADSTTSDVIITESVAKQLSDGSAIGLQVLADSSAPKWNVVGVIPDFHLYSMHSKADPLTIQLTSGNKLSYILIRVATQNPVATLELIKKTYAQLEPGVEFKGSYVDDNIARWYRNEAALSQTFSIAALVAIVLSCMGLFGIAFIVIRQRIKEIGVRKVLGASAANVAVLVTKEFIKPVLLAIVIAMPVAWWAMHKWLQGFEYRIPLQWTVFFIAAFTALAIAVATVSLQAIKAAISNPVKSLRTE